LSVTRGDNVIQQAEDGFGYPLLVSAVESSAPILPTTTRAALAGGQAVVGEIAAELRGAEIGDQLQLEAVTGEVIPVTIGAIVPDTEIRWSEVLVGLDVAAVLGIDRPFEVVIWGDSLPRVQAALRLALPQPAVRVLGPAWIDHSTSDPVLPIAIVKQRFGEFALRPAESDAVEVDDEWFDTWIVDVELPIVGLTRCHRMVTPYVRAALLEVERAGLDGVLDVADFQLAGGCYNPRFNRGADPGYSLSRHSWGIAIDFNPSTNQYGAEPTMPAEVVEIFRRWGFSWGGSWSVPDGMHFEWSHLPEVYPSNCSDLTMIETPPANSWLLAPGRGCS
jgi:hypothetical protein